MGRAELELSDEIWELEELLRDDNISEEEKEEIKKRIDLLNSWFK